ncbi:UNKNOWN [Stylonychia lemnae]|uniref:Uncharacterized protein n=1 Tax=Stylonychia lemnae TaxID=5949 RepID=A0A078A432_STYLE|nr:UNKNOWN [Stylonychia lemnae]|eukprot:CDW76634.1 UNKNOWN [Stylonychia lemnae]
MSKFSELEYFESQRLNFATPLEQLQYQVNKFYTTDPQTSIDIREIKQKVLLIEKNYGVVEQQSISNQKMIVPNKKFTILLLGDGQVGKSTIINQIFSQDLIEYEEKQEDLFQINQNGYDNSIIKDQRVPYFAPYLEGVFQNQDFVNLQKMVYVQLYPDVEFANKNAQICEALQIVESPAIDKVYKDAKGLKILLQGINQSADLVIIVLDSFDCDFRKSKLAKIVKAHFKQQQDTQVNQNNNIQAKQQNLATKEIWIILNKCDMFESQQEINEQIEFVDKQIKEITNDLKALEQVKVIPYAKGNELFKQNLLKELSDVASNKIKQDSQITLENNQKVLKNIDANLGYKILSANLGTIMIDSILANQKMMNSQVEDIVYMIELITGLPNIQLLGVMLLVVFIFEFTKQQSQTVKKSISFKDKKQLKDFSFYLQKYQKILSSKLTQLNDQ